MRQNHAHHGAGFHRVFAPRAERGSEVLLAGSEARRGAPLRLMMGRISQPSGDCNNSFSDFSRFRESPQLDLNRGPETASSANRHPKRRASLGRNPAYLPARFRERGKKGNGRGKLRNRQKQAVPVDSRLSPRRVAMFRTRAGESASSSSSTCFQTVSRTRSGSPAEK
jgi:hypothetical protein